MSDSPTAILDEIKAGELHGAAGGNVPFGDAENINIRKVGDVTIRMLDEAKGRMEVTDKNGRFLLVQRLSELERFDLYEAFGATMPNAYTAAMAALAATLRSIKNPDGTTTGRVFPRNMTHIRGALTLLGESGMDALRTAFAPEEKPAEADEGDTPDADGVMPDGSMALAKN